MGNEENEEKLKKITGGNERKTKGSKRKQKETEESKRKTSTQGVTKSSPS